MSSKVVPIDNIEHNNIKIDTNGDNNKKIEESIKYLYLPLKNIPDLKWEERAPLFANMVSIYLSIYLCVYECI
jgi:hypothetical protein